MILHHMHTCDLAAAGIRLETFGVEEKVGAKNEHSLDPRLWVFPIIPETLFCTGGRIGDDGNLSMMI